MTRWITGALAFAAVAVVAVHPSRLGAEPQAWNLFHYTLGPRFFADVGYWDLYPAVLEADRAGPGEFSDIAVVRDLRTQSKVARSALPAAPPLDPDRARELASWAAALRPLLPARAWADVFRDRGYNGSPALTAALQPIVAVLPPTTGAGRTALGAFDAAFLIAAVAAFGRRFGAGPAAGWALLFLTFPGVWGRQLGGFFEYDWVAALLVAAAARARGASGLAGVALGWAAATRLIPAAMAVATLAPALRRPRPEDGRLLAAFAATLLAGGLLGCATGRGPGAWVEFAERIAVHAAHHDVGEQRVGLAHLLTFDGDVAGSTEALRRATLAGRTALRALLGGLLAAAALVTAVRRPRAEALFHGLVVVFALSVTSRYHAAAFLAWPLVAARQTWMAPAFLALPLVAAALHGAGPYGTWLGLELALAGIVAARLIEVAARDVAVWRRWRRTRSARA